MPDHGNVFGWYNHVPGFLQKGLLEPLLGTRAAAAFALTRKAGSYVEQARAPMPDRLQMYNLIMRLGAGDVLTPQLMAQIDTAAPLRLERAVWQMPQNCSHLNKELAYDWRFTLAESDLPKVLGATGCAGVGVGFPMLDERLLAFSLKLPTRYKLKGLQLALVLQGSTARLSAGRDSDQEEAGLWSALWSLGQHPPGSKSAAH